MFSPHFWTLHILELKADIQLVPAGLAGIKILKILRASWEIVPALSP